MDANDHSLKGYDAWKTRSDLDDADRRRSDDRTRCWFCGAPVPDAPWAFWTSDGGATASLCDDCADRRVEVEQ